MAERNDLERDLVTVVERFNNLDNATEIDYRKAWDEVSALIESLGLREMGGPWTDLLQRLLDKNKEG